jgi:hypothetical protein
MTINTNKKSDNLLDLIPERNCKWDKAEDGRIYLFVPRFRNKLMKRFMLWLGRSEYVKVYFDNLGTRSWELIDGKRSIEEIGGLMEKGKDEPLQQFYERLSEFLIVLSRNKFVVLKKKL